MFFLVGFLAVLFLALVVVMISLKASQRQRSYNAPTRPAGGSMGRLHETMDAKAAAASIYQQVRAQGGLQPGRVYSTSYFQSMMPMPMVGFSDDWLWWQLVFSELNGMMMTDGYGFPACAYDYGGQPAIYFGDPGDPGLAPQFYGDPSVDAGVPFDPTAGSVLAPDAFPSDSGMQDAATMPDLPDPLAGTDTPMDAGDAGAGVDFGSGPDFGGGDDFGGGADFGGGGDFGGGDS